MTNQHHFLLITFPIQSHINPALQFAKCLIRLGAQVTFVTTDTVRRRMTNGSTPDGLSFVTFPDVYDDGLKDGDDVDHYLSEIKRRGSLTLTDLIVTSTNEGRPITCLVNTLTLPWAAEVARELHVPSALLWIQAATVLDIYYYYFNGYEDVITNKSSNDDPSSYIKLPGLPLLTAPDLPSFLLPSNAYTIAVRTFKEQIEALDKEFNPKILVNTFEELEPEALKAIERLSLTAIGPLIPSAFLDRRDSSDKSFGGDLFQDPKDYTEWLNSKPKSSTIYVSFGSISVLSKRQNEEIAMALLDCGRPFLWVIRKKERERNVEENKEEEEEEQKLSCLEELEKQGKIVPWCSQVEVLSHPSLGCFITHCGWNSTMESLVFGVPVIGFPQWTDQCTNSKLIEDVWKTGVRLWANEEGVVKREEITRCLELVMGGGERGEEMKKNAKKWKELAREAAGEGGSSDLNLVSFVNEISRSC